MTLSMRADIHEQWINELRSGNYMQGSGELHTITPIGFDEYDERFCCLGILCKMAAQEGVVEVERGETSRVAYGASGEEAYLPKEVIAWAGLRFDGEERKYTAISNMVEEERGILTNGTRERSYHDARSLSGLNDMGAPFKEIADVIKNEVVPY